MNIFDTIVKVFDRYEKPLKRIYIGLIVIFIIYSIHDIYKSLSGPKLIQALHALSPKTMMILILIGAISIVPMLIYDWVYSEKARLDISKPELITSSYVINTFTNIGGGGGIVGASLRIFLFGNVESEKETLKIVTQIALFTLTGLAINDIFAMIWDFNSFMNFHWYMKLVLFLFPLYLLVPFIAKNDTIKRIEVVKLLIGSTLEWLACLAFFTSIGYFLNFNFDVKAVYIGVIYAGIIGAITLIPGGFGSFDAAIIMTLNMAGISTDQALVWTLVYRICYYFVPFLIGLIMIGFKILNRRRHHQPIE